MKGFPDEETVKRIKEKYPKGTRVRLVHMNDRQAPPIGTIGTVMYVDDVATIHVAWSNGSSLGIVYGDDCCAIV